MKPHHLISLLVCLSLFTNASALAQPQDIIKACEADVKTHCAHVENGQGRIARCLQQNQGKLSDACKTKFDELQSRVRERHANRGAASPSSK
jgi:Cysteine rich repeat